MKITTALSVIRRMGCHVSYKDGEFRVTLVPRRTDIGSYFTNDADDAVATALKMLEQQDARMHDDEDYLDRVLRPRPEV